MYCLVPEKPLRLEYGTFYLAIGDTFYEAVIFNSFIKISFFSQLVGRKGSRIRGAKGFMRLCKKYDFKGIKYFCFGTVSMINGVKSVVRHYETKNG